VTASSDTTAMTGVVWQNPSLLLVRPAVNLFLIRYLRKFSLQRVGDQLIVHSHLPPLTSEAYSRFVKEHLVARVDGPSHAQIAVTNDCPQHCSYCYNRHRDGDPLDTATILDLVDRLKDMGVVWLGLTGGEPLLNPQLPQIVARAAGDCAVKLFTTGCGLTEALAGELAGAGLFSLAVSLDHWDAAVHDRGRGYRGAFQAAMDALEVAKRVPGLHVSVSSVVSRQAIAAGDVSRLVGFLETLGVHEAWLSEAKPSVEALWHEELVITEDERLALCAYQDDYNRRRTGMTLNYLGHFEGAEAFGCNAGCKMLYIDPFGEVSPCVFVPMSFGNVRDRPLGDIYEDMRRVFPSEDACFLNKNFREFAALGARELPLDQRTSADVLSRVRFGPLADFNRLLRGRTQ
jgi:MoaA/NifB/PqqE/SkfB family radical SAM enzyme